MDNDLLRYPILVFNRSLCETLKYKREVALPKIIWRCNGEDMTPNDIEILIHCHVSSQVHPRYDAPAVRATLEKFEEVGLIEKAEGATYYRTTEMGDAYVRVLCSTPLPTRRWVDQNGNPIDLGL